MLNFIAPFHFFHLQSMARTAASKKKDAGKKSAKKAAEAASQVADKDRFMQGDRLQGGGTCCKFCFLPVSLVLR